MRLLSNWMLSSVLLFTACDSKTRVKDFETPDGGDSGVDTDEDGGTSSGSGSAPGWELSWAVQAGGSLEGDLGDLGRAIEISSDDSLLTTGRLYSHEAVFGPDTGNEILIDVASDGGLFISNYSKAGVPNWVSTVRARYYECLSVSALSTGASLVSGRVENTPETPPIFGNGEPTETIPEVTCSACPFLAKYSPDGFFEWVAIGDGDDVHGFFWDVSTYPDGTSCVAGYFHDGTLVLGADTANETTLGPVEDDFDAVVARFESDGSLRWARRVSGPGMDLAYDTAPSSDGSCTITGYYEGSSSIESNGSELVQLQSSGNWGHIVARYDGSGNLEWVRDLGVEGDSTSDWPIVSVYEIEGGFVAAGGFNGAVVTGAPDSPTNTSSGPDGSNIGFYIMRIDSAGNRLWTATALGDSPDGTDSLNVVEVLENGTILVGGSFSGSRSFGVDEENETTLESLWRTNGFVALYSGEGDLIWSLRIPSGHYNYLAMDGTRVWDLAVDGADAIFATGGFQGTASFGTDSNDSLDLVSFGDNDVFVFRLDRSGPPD